MNPELSAREIEIIAHAAAGLGLKETGNKTGLQVTSVRSHRRRITKKLGSKNMGITYAVTLMYKRGVFTPDPVPDPFPITGRQMQVLLLVAAGLENVQIAERLGVSMDTVKTHMRRMFDKTNTKFRAHLVGESFRNGTLVLYRPKGTSRV